MGVLLFGGMAALFIVKKDCIYDLNLLQVNKEGNDDVEVEVFLEDVPVEFKGCLSPCEELVAWDHIKALGCGSYLWSPCHKEGVGGENVRSRSCMLFWLGLFSGSLWLVCVVWHPVILNYACTDCGLMNVDVRCHVVGVVEALRRRKAHLES